MSSLRKIIFLVLFFILLNIFSIYGFDYNQYFNTKSNNTSLNKNDSFTDELISFKDKVFSIFKDEEDKPISFTLTKKDGLLEMSGTFKNQSDAQKIVDFLNVNREADYNFEDNRVLDENLVENIAILISPFKDFFADGSKIIVNDNVVTISGVLKESNYKDLLDTLLSRLNIDLKTEIKLPTQVLEENLDDINEQNHQVVENRVESASQVKQIQSQTADITVIQERINKLLQNKKISFERRSSTMTEDSKAVVSEISNILKENTKIKFEIAGHTDSRGKDDLNKQISQDRANSVKEFLISLGIDSNRIIAVGYGEEFPIAKDDENGLSEINRRVEFKILGEQ